MAERATIFETVQIGVETVPGTPVAAGKKLQSVSIEPAVQMETKPFRAAGTKFPSIVVPQKEWVKANITGVPTFQELVYPLSSVLAYAAPVASGSGWKWSHSPLVNAADTVKTFTVEQGSSLRAHKFSNGLFTALGFTFSRDGIEITGEMIGNALTDGITMTSTPTVLSLIPVLPTQVDVYLADDHAGLDLASPLTRVLSTSWNISNRFGPLFPLATQYGVGYAATVETEPDLKCTLKMEADAAGMALLSTMRAGSTKFLRIEAIGPEYAVGEDYEFRIDTACKISEVSEFTDEDGVFAIEWTMTGVYDGTWDKATLVEVVNDLAAL